ncbi:MAG: hypothetical protein KBA14_06020 [Saprospiraceae bacterium]|nr:hypothetical protein [Saprospiraceae bacterium]
MNKYQHFLCRALTFSACKGWKALLISSSFLFMSCARYYYAPNSANIPLLSEKEAKINAQYAAGTVSKGFECQSAFAISRHFGGMINTMIGGSNYDEFEFNSGETRTKYIEIGPGYFTPIHGTSLVFETYGGIGTGGVKNKYYSGGDSKVSFTKLFVQPSIGVKRKGFEFGISSRVSWIHQKLASSSVSETHPEYLTLVDISKHPESFLWEPGLVLRLGGEKFLAQLQYTHSANLTNPDIDYNEETGYFTIGFSIPIKYKTEVAQQSDK